MVLVAHELLDAVVLEMKALKRCKGRRRWQRKGGIKKLDKPAMPSKVLPAALREMYREGKTDSATDEIRSSDLSRAALRAVGLPVGCATKQMGSGTRAHGLRRGAPVVKRASG